MNTVPQPPSAARAATARYARTIEASKRVRWDIDRDVIRGRDFDFGQTFLPAGLSLVDELPFLSTAERRLLGQVQGRTYANMFALVERFIGAKMLEVSRDHWLGDQVALEAIVRFSDEELKHQALFRRIEAMIAAGMPAGYRFVPVANDVAGFVLGKSTWAVLALTCHIELFSQAHYKASIEAAPGLSPLFRDLFRFHWQEEAQHAVVDELEWAREDARLDGEAARDAAVDDLIALVVGIDGLLQAQASADAGHFLDLLARRDGPPCSAGEAAEVHAVVLKAYRWQYIVSGALQPRFRRALASHVSPAQLQRVDEALAPLAAAVPRAVEARQAATAELPLAA